MTLGFSQEPITRDGVTSLQDPGVQVGGVDATGDPDNKSLPTTSHIEVVKK